MLAHGRAHVSHTERIRMHVSPMIITQRGGLDREAGVVRGEERV